MASKNFACQIFCSRPNLAVNDKVLGAVKYLPEDRILGNS